MADSENVMTASDNNFESDVLGAGEPVLVDFWAEWCGPCRMLAPTIETVAGEYTGKIKVFKMNVDENPTTPGKYNIRGIPTVLLFKGGQVVDQLVGNQPKEAFKEMIDRAL